MKPIKIELGLSFEGEEADDHQIDFYDVSQALVGFHRSLSLTTNLLLNGTIITQANALKGANILVMPPEDGSWRVWATIVLLSTGIYNIGTVSRDTPLGNLISSGYDYVIKSTLGFHVDYNKSLGQQYEELPKKEKLKHKLDESRLDSVIEKCEKGIEDMHRPIVFSETAKKAKISVILDGEEVPFKHPLTKETYDYISFTRQTEHVEHMIGRVSSYNINTFKGRMFVHAEKRPIPFMLMHAAKRASSIARITRSLALNARDRMREDGDIRFKALRNLSRTGRLKSLAIVDVD